MQITKAERAADFAVFRDILTATLGSITTIAWQDKTGTRPKDWTRHEVLAHLVSIVELFNWAAEQAVLGQNTAITGLTQRQDLPTWNATQIAALVQHSPFDLITRLLVGYNAAAERVAHLNDTDAEKRYFLKVYNRSARAIDFLDWHLSHLGVVHAAQLTRGIAPPLWDAYPADFTHRLIDRFMRHFSVAYWQDYGNGQTIILGFQIEGEGGDDWHLVAAPDGGYAGYGRPSQADFRIHYANPSVLFGLFTVEIPFQEALKRGALTIEGGAEQALGWLKLFAANPPRSA